MEEEGGQVGSVERRGTDGEGLVRGEVESGEGRRWGRISKGGSGEWKSKET